MDKAIALFVKCSDLKMDRFYDNLGMVKTVSIKVKHIANMLQTEVSKSKLRY